MKKIKILPEQPPVGLLESMATCENHGFGLPGLCEDEEAFKERKKQTLYLMRKFYDEVSGHGYYSYNELNIPSLIQEHDFKNLKRFEETSSDGEGYDVKKEDMERLAEIGAIRYHGKKVYSITSFGQSILDRDNKNSLTTVLITEEDSWKEFQDKIDSKK